MTASLERALLFLYAETPVHAGADTGLGALDLPIQREVTTGLPIIKGESLKGALRERFRPPVIPDALWRAIFGDPPPRTGTPGGKLAPGALRVHEAQLVAFPVPTLDGFAWVTSPLARARLHRRACLAGVTALPGDAGSSASGEGDDRSCLRTDTRLEGSKTPPQKSAVLGSYAFTSEADFGFRGWAQTLANAALPGLDEHRYFRDRLLRDLYQVSDVAMKAITGEGTEITARVQLGGGEDDEKPTKTVAHGPFYSEYLPGETLLAALLESASADHLATLREHIDDKVLQVGGDETIGKGLMWCRMPEPGDFVNGPAAGTAEAAE